jgi:thiol-disulfide isomerase/thioredoxin
MREPIISSVLLSVLLCTTVVTAAQAPATAPQKKPDAAELGPSDAKAKKTFSDAVAQMRDRHFAFALDGFRKADKQDGGHCIPCERQAWKAAVNCEDYKAARTQAAAITANATDPSDKVLGQFLMGEAFLNEGFNSKHDDAMIAADAAFQTALQLQPTCADCLYADGQALAHLKRDELAKERFQEFLKAVGPHDIDYARVQRFVERPELARARMAPNFGLKTLDGKTLTLESLTGKVVLIDFWATWCGPCREALPHVKEIAHKFEGQPFAVLSVSLDNDEARWKDFVGKNGMTWLQYRDGGFTGRIATQFGVRAIPATFTIDADGVLEDQHVGDSDIDGKLKKLVARAVEVNNRKMESVTPQAAN